MHFLPQVLLNPLHHMKRPLLLKNLYIRRIVTFFVMYPAATTENSCSKQRVTMESAAMDPLVGKKRFHHLPEAAVTSTAMVTDTSDNGTKASSSAHGNGLSANLTMLIWHSLSGTFQGMSDHLFMMEVSEEVAEPDVYYYWLRSTAIVRTAMHKQLCNFLKSESLPSSWRPIVEDVCAYNERLSHKLNEAILIYKAHFDSSLFSAKSEAELKECYKLCHYIETSCSNKSTPLYTLVCITVLFWVYHDLSKELNILITSENSIYKFSLQLLCNEESQEKLKSMKYLVNSVNQNAVELHDLEEIKKMSNIVCDLLYGIMEESAPTNQFRVRKFRDKLRDATEGTNTF